MATLIEKYPEYEANINKARQAGFSDTEIEANLRSKGVMPQTGTKDFLSVLGQKFVPDEPGIMGVLGAAGDVLSIPQHLATSIFAEGGTFTERFERGIDPSELLNLGGAGGFAADVILDPLNLAAGAGLLSKLSKGRKVVEVAKTLPKAGDDIIDYVLKNARKSGKLDVQKVGRSSLLENPIFKSNVLIDQDAVKMLRGKAISREILDNIRKNTTPEQIARVNAKVDAGIPLTPEEITVQGASLIKETAQIIDDTFEAVLNPEVGRALGISAQWGRSGFALSERNKSFFQAFDELLKKYSPAEQKAIRKNAESMFGQMFNKGELNPGWDRKLVEFATMIKLTGLSTHIRAVIGNGSELMLRYPEKIAAGILDTFYYGLRGKGRNVYASEALPEFMGMLNGFMGGVRDAFKILRDPTLALQEATKAGEVGFRAGGAIKGTTGEIVRAPGRLIGAIDVLFKNMNKGAEIYAQAWRKALKDGKRGAELVRETWRIAGDPGEEILKLAKTSAQQRVFQEQLQGLLQTFNTVRDKHPIARLIMPFYNTPINLFKRAVQRTPGTMLLPSTWDVLWRGKEITKGGKTFRIAASQAEKVELLGRALVGSTFLTTAAIAGLQGRISSRGPTSKAERQMLRRTGWAPNSIKFGDTWWSYRGFEPISSWLRALGDMGESGNEISLDAGSKMVFSFMKQFAENPFWMGINDIYEALSDPERKGPEAISAIVIGATIPNFIQQWGTRYFDPIVREPKGILEEAMARIPRVSKTIKPMRNIYGEPIKRDLVWAQNLGFGISLPKGSRIDKELARLNVSIGLPSQYVNGVKLNEDEYDRLLVVKGSMLKQTLNRFVNSPGYAKIDDMNKIRVIRSIVSKVNRYARSLEFEKYYKERR